MLFPAASPLREAAAVLWGWPSFRKPGDVDEPHSCSTEARPGILEVKRGSSSGISVLRLKVSLALSGL